MILYGWQLNQRVKSQNIHKRKSNGDRCQEKCQMRTRAFKGFCHVV